MNTPNNVPDQIIALLNAAKEHWNHLRGRYLYTIRINVPLSVTYRFTSTQMNTAIRVLVNSKCSVGAVENRTWFNSHFRGGAYAINVMQDRPEVQPEVTYILICLSDKSALDGNVATNLERRVKKIFNPAMVTISDSIKLNSFDLLENKVFTALNRPSVLYVNSEPIDSKEKHLRKWLVGELNPDIRTFGCFYHLVHQPYNMNL